MILISQRNLSVTADMKPENLSISAGLACPFSHHPTATPVSRAISIQPVSPNFRIPDVLNFED